MNYYAVLKGNLQVLNKIQPKDFQISLEKLLVTKFQLVEIETYFTIRFIFFTKIEMLSIKNK